MSLKYLVRMSTLAAMLLLMGNLHASPQIEKEAEEVFATTTLIEISPEVTSQYHRLIGKIEGSVSDEALSEELIGRLISWLEAAGSEKPQTFDTASSSLLGKIKQAEREFDRARSTGQLSAWLSTQEGDASTAQGEKTPRQGFLPEPAPLSNPSEVKTNEVTAQEQAVGQAKPATNAPYHVPMIMQYAILALISFIAFWVYPKFIETEKMRFTQNLVTRYFKRAVFAITSAVIASIILALFVADIP